MKSLHIVGALFISASLFLFIFTGRSVQIDKAGNNASLNKRIVVFMGPPGSGKGTLAQLCVDKLGWVQLSTGDLCRRNIAEKTKVGQQIETIIKSGQLIPDAIMIKMVEAWMIDQFKNLDVLILDGFPRTAGQAEALQVLLTKEEFASVKFHLVVLSLADEIVEARLTSRLVCPNKGCGASYSKTVAALAPKVALRCDKCPGTQLIVRPDDTVDAVKNRLEIYHKNTSEILDYYQAIGQLMYKLDADKSLEHIFEDFSQIISDKIL